MVHTVNISQLCVSNRWDEVIVAYSLGSCLAVTLYDPVARAGGLAHCLLPSSVLDPAKGEQRPGMFVDTAITALLRELRALGASEERLVAKIAGAAQFLDSDGAFRVGERNQHAALKLLQRRGIRIHGQDTGTSMARTVFLYLDSGRLVVRGRDHEWEL